MTITLTTDLTFARINAIDLKLDLYLPDHTGPLAVVIYLHGGGWARGDKADDTDTRIKPIAEYGIAVASVNYRLAPDTVYPGQVHDVKAAVRWLRAHGNQYGIDTDRIGLWGASAGAMLALLTGLTPGDPVLEGALGDDLGQSSEVQAIVDWCGPTDFVTNATRSPMEARILPPPFEQRLFGPDTPEELVRKAQEASPYARISPAAPPVLIMHGDRDRMVPLADAQAFHNALSRQGGSSTLITLAGIGHDDPAFESACNIGITAAFLKAALASH